MKKGIPHDFRNGYSNEVILLDKNGLVLLYNEDSGRNYPLTYDDVDLVVEEIEGHYHTIGYTLSLHPDKTFYIEDLYLEVRDYAHTRLHLWYAMIDYDYEKENR